MCTTFLLNECSRRLVSATILPRLKFLLQDVTLRELCLTLTFSAAGMLLLALFRVHKLLVRHYWWGVKWLYYFFVFEIWQIRLRWRVNSTILNTTAPSVIEIVLDISNLTEQLLPIAHPLVAFDRANRGIRWNRKFSLPVQQGFLRLLWLLSGIIILRLRQIDIWLDIQVRVHEYLVQYLELLFSPLYLSWWPCSAGVSGSLIGLLPVLIAVNWLLSLWNFWGF